MAKDNKVVIGSVVRVRIDNVLEYGAMCHILNDKDEVVQKCLMPSKEIGKLPIRKGDILEAKIIEGYNDKLALVPCKKDRPKKNNVVSIDGSLDIALEYMNAATLIIKKFKETNH